MSEQERKPETDPQKRTHPFELPNGETVLIKHITSKDYDELNTWIRKQYMENCGEATQYMNIVEKQEFMLAALAHAASLTFLYGDGRDILFGSVYGMARLCYQMIQNPPFSFEKFKNMLFPEDFIEEQGVLVVGDMLNLANTGKIDRSIMDTPQPAQESDVVEKVVGEMISESV